MAPRGTQGVHKQVGPGGTGMGPTRPGANQPGHGSYYNPVRDSGVPRGVGGVNPDTNNVVVGGGSPLPSTNNTGPSGTTSGGGGGGRRYGYGGGGGGGGAPTPDWGKLASVMSFTPRKYIYRDYEPEMYEGTGFYDFNSDIYDRARQGLEEGLAADLAQGAAAYNDARTELQQYQNPFAGRSYSTNPEMSDAMQRMLAANNATVTDGAAEQARAAQADAAMGNVLALLGANADQRQAAEMRALSGDERRFNESLQNQGRSMSLGIDMALANARAQYEKEKWQYGEEIARQNYNARAQAAMYNHQGRAQTMQANIAQGNQYYGDNMRTLLEMIAAGQKPPDMLIAGAMGLTEGGGHRYY